MGNYQDKAEVIVAQDQSSGKVIEQYNWLSTWQLVIAGLLALIILYFIYTRTCKSIKSWLRYQVTELPLHRAQFPQQQAKPATPAETMPSATPYM